jgi:antitoxin HicB
MPMTNLDQEVARYMAMPYRIELVPDPHGWFVRIPELPGCMSQGDTQEEALAMIRDAQQLWLRGALEDGWTIPEPRAAADYSGKFNVRVPRRVHRDLVHAAEDEGVSLNLFVATALARATGLPQTAGAENARKSTVANGSFAGDAVPLGILERFGALSKRLAVVNDRISRGMPVAESETPRLTQEYKVIERDAAMLFAAGSIEQAWVNAALNSLYAQLRLTLAGHLRAAE